MNSEILQEQFDEITALQCIYLEQFHPIEIEKPPYTYQISINPILQSPIMLQAEYENNSSTGTTKSSLLRLSHLLPINLRITLTPDYPRYSPPDFRLTCSWLTNQHLTRLCAELDNLWRDQEGFVIVFNWLDFLQNQALIYLGLTEEVPLIPGGGPREDKRAFSETSEFLEETIRDLVQYNAQEEKRIFLESQHECQVCYSDVIGRDMHQMSCLHSICKSCATEHCRIKIREGNVLSIFCTEKGCKTPYSENDIKTLVSSHEYRRWKEKVIESNPKATYCPRCQNLAEKDSEKLAQCSTCYYSFCPLCLDSYHPASVCFEGVSEEFLAETTALVSSDKTQKLGRKEELLRQMQQRASLLMIQKSSVECPNCNIRIEKNGGCNKMTCTNCHLYFCFTCNQPITGYEHFSQTECQLWDAETLNAWAREMNVPVRARPRGNENGEKKKVTKLKPCPTCKVDCVKTDNNNHVLCWNCFHHMCFYCGKTVRNSASHFRSIGCPQHTREVETPTNDHRNHDQRINRPLNLADEILMYDLNDD